MRRTSVKSKRAAPSDLGPSIHKNLGRIDTSTSTTKTSFLLGDWAALLGVVGGVFGPRKWPSIGSSPNFHKMDKIF